MTISTWKQGWGAGVAALALVGLVFADEGQKKKSDADREGTDVSVQIGGGKGINVEVRHGRKDQDQAHKDLQSGHFAVRRLSKFYTMNLYNDKGEDVGDVENVVIDPHVGQIVFAIAEFDDALGVGNQQFAIPWSAIHKEVDDKNFDRIAYSMKVDQDKLKQARGFDEDNWPNFADRNVTRDLYALWGQPPYWEGQTAQALMRGRPMITGTPISPDQKPGQRGALILRSNDLVGHKLLDQNGQEFAELEEIMADPKTGALLYAIVQIDQAPDFSRDHLYAVPWKLISVRQAGQAGMERGAGADVDRDQPGRTPDQEGRADADQPREQPAGEHARDKVLTDPDSFQLVLNVSRDKLKNAPRFGERDWPNMTPQWGEQVYTYYGVEPVWKGGMEKGGESGSAEPPGAGTDRDR